MFEFSSSSSEESSDKDLSIDNDSVEFDYPLMSVSPVKAQTSDAPRNAIAEWDQWPSVSGFSTPFYKTQTSIDTICRKTEFLDLGLGSGGDSRESIRFPSLEGATSFGDPRQDIVKNYFSVENVYKPSKEASQFEIVHSWKALSAPIGHFEASLPDIEETRTRRESESSHSSSSSTIKVIHEGQKILVRLRNSGYPRSVVLDKEREESFKFTPMRQRFSDPSNSNLPPLLHFSGHEKMDTSGICESPLSSGSSRSQNQQGSRVKPEDNFDRLREASSFLDSLCEEIEKSLDIAKSNTIIPNIILEDLSKIDSNSSGRISSTSESSTASSTEIMNYWPQTSFSDQVQGIGVMQTECLKLRCQIKAVAMSFAKLCRRFDIIGFNKTASDFDKLQVKCAYLKKLCENHQRLYCTQPSNPFGILHTTSGMVHLLNLKLENENFLETLKLAENMLKEHVRKLNRRSSIRIMSNFCQQ
ncbi:hypothetical protein CDAR_425251 [Caerostris darwini]|uniref:Uncharacterized protein n=1 Tax=Caerostris darwini TaxID=1538125 RepID=A0AAV4VSK2_9ARAC|nr:hypothetical protein CDAR_425251 [Caerostris darwini]